MITDEELDRRITDLSDEDLRILADREKWSDLARMRNLDLRVRMAGEILRLRMENGSLKRQLAEADKALIAIETTRTPDCEP